MNGSGFMFSKGDDLIIVELECMEVALCFLKAML